MKLNLILKINLKQYNIFKYNNKKINNKNKKISKIKNN